MSDSFNLRDDIRIFKGSFFNGFFSYGVNIIE